MPTPLSPLGNLFQGLEAVRMAYVRVLALEYERPVAIRILGWMLIHAPNGAGQAHLASSIDQCSNTQAIIALGEYYFQYFLKYFRAIANKPTPTPSNHPDPSIDDLRDMIMNSVDQAPTGHSQAKKRALVRDNYRCQLTGTVDTEAYLGSPMVEEQVDANALNVSQTECHHILPQYIGHNITDNPERTANASMIWSIVQIFGGIPQVEVNGPGIHHLRNIMTLRGDIHTAFDRLQVWLEPVDGQDNVYNIGRLRPAICRDLPATVTLTTNTGLPLPDRRYLALQAACAKVVCMSGAAEPIDSILRDAEETKVLSQDGSSVSLLDMLLYGHAPA
ncbi:unnamed protein product [Rhizoctonia solani]|uniref:HNH nuclease domain-containing protein n=1 Tax=Rhizoctonia solani TaxID=456999 RepID=A0A8H3E5D2_9AGAM|nr:unnamed protein product [Rhizoctonia solani]